MQSIHLQDAVVRVDIKRDSDEEAAIRTSGQQGKQSGHEKTVEAHGIQPTAKDWNAVVKRCVLFDGLSSAEKAYLLQGAHLMKTEAGTYLYKQEDTPSMLYLVYSGRYRALKATSSARAGDPAKCRDFGPGDDFGACELLTTMGGRTHAVKVIEGGWVWGISQRHVASKLKIPPPMAPGSSGVLDFLQSVRLFGGIAKERMVQLCRCMSIVELKPGANVFDEGSFAESLYVLMSGSIDTTQTDSDFRVTLLPPDSLGESALFPEEDTRVRHITAHAGERGAKLIKFKASGLETLVGFDLQVVVVPFVHRRLFSMVKCAHRFLADGLRVDDMDKLMEQMEEQIYHPKEIVVAESDYDDTLHIIKHGTALISRSGHRGEWAELATLKRGDCFGEQALQLGKKSKRRGTVTVVGSEPLVTLTLTHDLLMYIKFQGEGLSKWVDQLLTDVTETAVAGVDASVVAAIQESGDDVDTKIPPIAKGKGRGNGKANGSVSSAPKKSQDGSDKKASGRFKTRKISQTLVAQLERISLRLSVSPDQEEQATGGEKPRRSSIVQRIRRLSLGGSGVEGEEGHTLRPSTGNRPRRRSIVQRIAAIGKTKDKDSNGSGATINVDV